jgi:excisionase family DNA binding protein
MDAPRGTLLTLQEVADLLHVHRNTARRRFVEKGMLRPIRIGRAARYAPEDVASLVERLKARQNDEGPADHRASVKTVDAGDGRGES